MHSYLNGVKMKKPRSPKPRDSYHHGALRAALIAAAEAVLDERGADGFSLRETARRAGVSPSAPAHHFGDARGLLTAIAARGFEELTEVLAKAAANATSATQVEAQAVAYVQFALRRGSIFTLMWRREVLDIANTEYLAAGRKAFNVFERAATQRDVPVAEGPRMPEPAVLAAWSMIHGYARLVLDGAIDRSAPGLTQSVMSFLPKVPKPPNDGRGSVTKDRS